VLLEKGNMWDTEADAYCVPTNGYVKCNGEAVMGCGVAKQVVDMLHGVEKYLGDFLKSGGNIPYIIGCCCSDSVDGYIVSFPTKGCGEVYNDSSTKRLLPRMSRRYSRGTYIPGFCLKSEISLIEASAKILVKIVDDNGWKRIVLPRVGCGAGGLFWGDVEPILANIFDDRFVVRRFSS